MNAFVGVSEKLLSEEELRHLLELPSTTPTYYFLRWANRVSGIVDSLEGFPSPEGQMFNSDRELRWKQQGQMFSVLLLSTTELEPGFKALGEKWQFQEREAHIYKTKETRFPKEFQYRGVSIAQRYFIDAQTVTVHFVSLTVAKKP